jgi:hypothetical protein
VLGKGQAIFQQISQMQHLQLGKAQSYECGVAVLHYTIKNQSVK